MIIRKALLILLGQIGIFYSDNQRARCINYVYKRCVDKILFMSQKKVKFIDNCTYNIRSVDL